MKLCHVNVSSNQLHTCFRGEIRGISCQIVVLVDVIKGQDSFFNPRYNFGVSKMKKKNPAQCQCMKVFSNQVVKHKQKDNEPISTINLLGRPKVQKASCDTKWRRQQHIFLAEISTPALPCRCHIHVGFMSVEISGQRIISSDVVPASRLKWIIWLKS